MANKILKDNWNEILNTEQSLDLPIPKWKNNWSIDPKNASMIYNCIKIRKPKIIIETGTFEAHGTYVMAKAAHENNNDATIITIDYDGDPTTELEFGDWINLREIRDRNIKHIQDNFFNCNIEFINGDSREVLKKVFPERISCWDFFYHDSMHYKEGILAEWLSVRQYIRKGSIAVFDDISIKKI